MDRKHSGNLWNVRHTYLWILVVELIPRWPWVGILCDGIFVQGDDA